MSALALLNNDTLALNAKDGRQHVAADGSYRTAALSRGEVNGIVSSQWASRPEDQRFTSLSELLAFKRDARERSFVQEIDATEIRVEANAQEHGKLSLVMPKGDIVRPTHWAFQQLCSTIGASAQYLRKLPARIASVPLQYSLMAYDGRHGSTLSAYMRHEKGRDDFLSINSTTYGRIYDEEVVSSVMKVAGNGNGDSRWKVPGMIDWGSSNGTTVRYNPEVDVTKDTTSLFGSDRDIFIFLVDDRNPIEVGTLPNGEPDLMFRGFGVRNSEVGAYEYEVFYCLLRGVCQNRNLWGVEGFKNLRIRHTSGAPARFIEENEATLLSFAEQSAQPVIEAVTAAKARTIGKTEEAAIEWLCKHGATKKQATEAALRVRKEEGHEMRSLWDANNGLTAYARTIGHNDKRLMVEEFAAKLIEDAVG